MGRFRFRVTTQNNRNIPEEHIDDKEYIGCTSKQTYYNEKQAANVALMVRATRGGNIYPYHCKYCDLWHIGHSRY